MGIEFKGNCEKPFLPVPAKRALVGHFVALQWKIVREQEPFLGVAIFGPREPGCWDEDFRVGIKDDYVYLLIHGSGERLIKNTIGDALRLVGGRMNWEEL